MENIKFEYPTDRPNFKFDNKDQNDNTKFGPPIDDSGDTYDYPVHLAGKHVLPSKVSKDGKITFDYN